MSEDRPDPPSDAATLARLTGAWHAPTVAAAGAAPPPDRLDIPGYEVLGEIGRGGMGVVYHARHTGLNRDVALKMVLAGAHAGSADRTRFRSEAEAVARLHHPNVVQVYDVGEAGGLPYLSLELCAASLEQQLDGTPWLPRRAAELVETLARAVHAAHQAGVVHRDLKPGNVLFAGDGTPKITDFGLAKRLDSNVAGPTSTGAVLGTPSYMAPEQAGGRPGGAAKVGPAADLYALGVLLYELLTGRPPFKAATPLDTLLQVARDEPVPPARLAPKTPRDLQTVCLKCLEKDPARRYTTAEALADDLRRFLTDEPIRARPVPRWERGWKWAKRRPAAAALVAVSTGAVVALLGLAWVFTDRLLTERDAARQARADADASAALARTEARNARRQNYVLAMGQVQLAWQQSALTRLRKLLAAQVPPAGEEDLRGWEWHYWDRRAHGPPHVLRPPNAGPLAAVAYSRDGRRLVAVARGGTVAVWDAATDALVRTLAADGPLDGLAVTADGGRVAVAGKAGVQVFDAATGDRVVSIDLRGGASGVAYSPDGRRLAVLSGDRASVRDADTGTLIRELPALGGRSWAIRDWGVAFSPDGRRVAAGGGPGKIWDAESGDLLRTLPGGSGLAYGPDGHRLALIEPNTKTRSAEIRVVSADTGAPVARLRGHTDDCSAVAFSPDGGLLASAGDDNTVRVWDVAAGRELHRFKGGSLLNTGVAFRPDGRAVAVSTAGGAVELWPLGYDQDATTVKAAAPAGGRYVALHADAGRVLGLGLFGAILADAYTRAPPVLTAGRAPISLTADRTRLGCAAISPDGRVAATGSAAGTVGFWDAATGQALRAVTVGRSPVFALAFSGDGRRLAAAVAGAAAEPWRVLLLDPATGLEVGRVRDTRGPVYELALSADGRVLLTGQRGKLVARAWDATDGRLLHTLADTANDSLGSGEVALSPDGRWAAAGSSGDEQVILFDLASGALVHRLDGHLRGIVELAFSPDGRRLASASDDETVKVWDVATGQEVLSRPAPPGVVDVAFTTDGRRLLAVAQDGTVRAWDAGP